MNTLPSENAVSPRVAVIGGGISGLAAAHRLVELLPHAQITLFEAADRLGGILETIHRDGFLVERSADNFLTKLPAAVDLCRRLGLSDQLLRTDETRRRATVARNGRLLPIPEGFYLMSPRKLGPLLKSPVLSPLGKLRLLAEPLVPRRPRNFDVADTAQTGADLNSAADESVADFACRRLGRETFERLVQPLVAGIYTADPTKLSMAATMPEFVAYERDFGSLLRATLRRPTTNKSPSPFREGVRGGASSDEADSASGARYSLFAAPKNGLTSLVTALADRLPADNVRLRSPIADLQRDADGRWRITIVRQGGAESFDAVIVAVPAPHASKLLTSFDAELAAELAGIPYASSVVVSCAFKRAQIRHPLDSFGFIVPQIENRPIIAASFASQKFSGRAPDDGVLIRTFLGGAMRPNLVDLPDTELGRLTQDELAALLGITGLPLFTDVARWRKAMPQYHVGHVARVERIERRTARWPGFELAGNAYHGVGIPQCIASGEAAAERIASWLG